MQSAHIVRETNITRTPRLVQMEGIFAVAPSDRSVVEWDVSLQLPDHWNIGLIVGPSGSGKTTVARELFGDYLARDWNWPDNQSVLDGFPDDLGIREIVDLLSSVGFSSPPSWVRPFRVLSTGEQFRVNIARTLAELKSVAVVDEFTSVVDRTVAQIGSAAIQKTVRQRGQKFIAVSCHYDIAEWLEPDWIYEPHTNAFTVGRLLRRPQIKLEIVRVHHKAWELFGKHHYLDQRINPSAICFCAFWKQEPVAFCCALAFPHATRPGWRLHRLVVMPDFQGVGIGSRLSDYVASILKSTGKPVFRTAAHPSVLATCAKSPVWSMRRAPGFTANAGKKALASMKSTLANNRYTAGFEYVGQAMPKDTARCIMGD